MAGKAKGKFKVLIGVNYGPTDKRAEPGDIIDDFPAADAKSFVEQGILERMGD